MAATETTTFESELAAAARLDMRRNPFIGAMTAGRCSRDVVRRYAAGVFSFAETFPQLLLAIASRCDDREVRLALLENLMEEEGIVAIDGGHFVVDESRRHPALARRFAHAAGVSDDDLRAAAAAAPVAAKWLHGAIAADRVAAALAYVTIGFEANTPATMILLASALEKNYGFASHDLEFLTAHVEADAGHAAAGLRLTARIARDDAARADAIRGAHRGAAAWWWWHRSLMQVR